MTDDTVRIEMCRKGQLSLWAVVDEADYPLVSQHKWYLAESAFTFYVMSRTADGGTLYMHRLILQASAGMEVDHVDRDGLNNRRSNLRVASRRENVRNRRGVDVMGGRPTTSRFKGVSRHDKRKPASPWEARIQVGGRREHLGLYANEEDAARAYDRRAREAYGEFAYLNFPDELAS